MVGITWPRAKAYLSALADNQSVNAAAKALGMPRVRLGAEAVRLGLRAYDPVICEDNLVVEDLEAPECQAAPRQCQG